ncbi:MAG: cytochrome c3 family protein [Ignavibacteria bacterium]|nr:cytochrome c3 family protein [Ignavibacteria bacterium]
MKNILSKYIFVIFCLIFSQITNAKTDECFNCHSGLDDSPSKLFKNDIHQKVGLSCSSCHGGDNTSDDMEISMDKKNGFLGIPSQNKISEICAKCHSDIENMKKYRTDISTGQLEELKKSVHGAIAVDGKGMILQCTTCHNAHGIKKVTDSGSLVYPTNIPNTCNKCHGDINYMRKYNPGLSVDQLAKYRESKHGKLNLKGNRKVAQCASCHGSHAVFTSKDVRSKVYPLNIPETCSTCHSDKEYMKESNIPTDQFEKYKKSVHGVALFEKKDISAPVCNSCHGNHAATPPGISSISKICGTCHALNAELFGNSPHKKVFDENNYPECETCHGNHLILVARDQLLGVNEGAVCAKCHTEEKNPKGFKAAVKMRALIDSLVVLDSISRRQIFIAEQKGMEVEEAKFKLRDVHQAELEARTVVHAFDAEKFSEIINKGVNASNEVISEANSQVDEYYFRRYGLVVAVLIISLLALLLYFQIKRIEAKQNL